MVLQRDSDELLRRADVLGVVAEDLAGARGGDLGRLHAVRDRRQGDRRGRLGADGAHERPRIRVEREAVHRVERDGADVGQHVEVERPAEVRGLRVVDEGLGARGGGRVEEAPLVEVDVVDLEAGDEQRLGAPLIAPVLPEAQGRWVAGEDGVLEGRTARVHAGRLGDAAGAVAGLRVCDGRGVVEGQDLHELAVAAPDDGESGRRYCVVDLEPRLHRGTRASEIVKMRQSAVMRKYSAGCSKEESGVRHRKPASW